MPRPEHDFDVVIATDCRLPGGTAASTAEEIAAQARYGLRTGLIHIDTPLVSRTRPLNPRLRAALERGDAELVLPDRIVSTRVLVIRHPKAALGLAGPAVPVVKADCCVVLINQEPVTGANVHYRADEVNAAVRGWVGLEPLWAPIGPLVRQRFAEAEPQQPMTADDWVNIIDVDAWGTERAAPTGRPPRIGRHSRDHRLKWPATAEAVLAAYPPTPEIDVRVLGGIPQVLNVLGGTAPSNWTLIPFGKLDVREFLSGLDVFVYFHHHDLTEAFGRTILEAMAAGLPVITDRRFEALFGDHAIYVEPSGVSAAVMNLVSDPDEYAHYSREGRRLANARFGYEVHIRRLAALTGIEPDLRAATTEHPPAPDDGPSRTTVMFISPNGAGMGHLTRVMATARRLPPDIDARFFTFSTAAGVVEQQGFVVEYSPSRSVTKARSGPWHAALTERLESLITQWRPNVIVIDGTDPYRGALRALVNHPDIPAVWMRRGMWKPGVTNTVLQHGAGIFDLVIEPGEAAADNDRGATRSGGGDASLQVAPITYVGHGEVLGRDEARRQLGLTDSEPTVLVHLGAGNINDTATPLRIAAEAFTDAGWRVVAAQSRISLAKQGLDDRVTGLDLYPLARHLRAFDVVLAAAGYNSFHELLMAGVVTGFVPNDATITDDQRGRAQWAHDQGLARCARDDSPAALRELIDDLLDPSVSSAIRARLATFEVSNGAEDAAAAIAALARDPRSVGADSAGRRAAAMRAVQRAAMGPVRAKPSRNGALARATGATRRAVRRAAQAIRDRVGDARLRAAARRLPATMRRPLRRAIGVDSPKPRRAVPSALLPTPAGRLLGAPPAARLSKVLVVITTPDGAPAANSEIVDAVAKVQAVERTFAPIFLTESLDAAPFSRYGYVWEHLRRRAAEIETETEWHARRGQRIGQVRRWYAADIVVEVGAAEDVTSPRSLLSQLVRQLDPTL